MSTETADYWLRHPDMPDAEDVATRGRYSRRASQFLGGWRMVCYGEKFSEARAREFATKKRHAAYWTARGVVAALDAKSAGIQIKA